MEFYLAEKQYGLIMSILNENMKEKPIVVTDTQDEVIPAVENTKANPVVQQVQQQTTEVDSESNKSELPAKMSVKLVLDDINIYLLKAFGLRNYDTKYVFGNIVTYK